MMRWCWLIVLIFVASLGLPSAQSREEIGMAAARASGASAGLLQSRPTHSPSQVAQDPGLHWLDVGSRRPAAVFVRPGTQQGKALPLVLLLHVAGGDAAGILPLIQAEAEARGFLLPGASVGWRDLGRHPAWVRRRCPGHGPGAGACVRAHRSRSDARGRRGIFGRRVLGLSIGLGNGELFSVIRAFSPGFMAPGRISGQPWFFMSHGIRDEVLPIDRCSRRIAPELRRAGYDVDYREFDGPHIVPAGMVAAALDRFLRD